MTKHRQKLALLDLQIYAPEYRKLLTGFLIGIRKPKLFYLYYRFQIRNLFSYSACHREL